MQRANIMSEHTTNTYANRYPIPGNDREWDPLIRLPLSTPPKKDSRKENRKMADHVRIQLRPQNIRVGTDTEVLLREDKSVGWRINALHEKNIEPVWFDKAAEV